MGDSFSVEKTSNDSTGAIFRITCSTSKLRAGTTYTLQFQGYDLCGKLQTASTELRYTQSHITVPVLASCAAENDCTYYVNESMVKRVVSLPDVDVYLAYLPLGYNFSAKITGNTLKIAKIGKNEVTLGKHYSMTISETSLTAQ